MHSWLNKEGPIDGDEGNLIFVNCARSKPRTCDLLIRVRCATPDNFHWSKFSLVIGLAVTSTPSKQQPKKKTVGASKF